MSSTDLGSGLGDQDFATLWAEMGETFGYVNPQRGDIRRGVVMSSRRDQVLIDIGAKHDAMLAYRELQELFPDELVKLQVGAEVNVYVLRLDDRTDTLLVSLKQAAEYEHWLDAQALLDSGEIVQLTVTGYNKGGLVCQYGPLQGFIPASQVSELGRRVRHDAQTDALAQFVGQEMPLKVIEVNRRRRRLIFSQRLAVREWRAQQRERLFGELQVGQVREGTVSNLCDFGAFVDLGGLDGLVHLSELSWARVRHPGEVLSVGETVRVMVLNVDQDRQRVGLSLKRTMVDPWVTIEERFVVGQSTQGIVSHIVDFGAFVELEPGVEGLIHISELAYGDVGDANSVVTEGEQLTVLVLGVDAERHRMSLSLRQVEGLVADAATSLSDEGLAHGESVSRLDAERSETYDMLADDDSAARESLEQTESQDH